MNENTTARPQLIVNGVDIGATIERLGAQLREAETLLHVAELERDEALKLLAEEKELRQAQADGIALAGGAFAAGAEFARLYRAGSASNYAEFEAHHADMGALLFSIQRKQGKTPAMHARELLVLLHYATSDMTELDAAAVLGLTMPDFDALHIAERRRARHFVGDWLKAREAQQEQAAESNGQAPHGCSPSKKPA